MYTSDNDRLFVSKLSDGIYLCEKRRQPYFFSFMTEREQAVAAQYLESEGFRSYAFFGGSDVCERKVLGLFGEESGSENFMVQFPVKAIEFTFRKTDKLTHRDFLGSLMALGIERETVGDILVEDGRCVVFVKEEIFEYVCSQISKIGRVGVKIGEPCLEDLPKGRGVQELFYTVSSMRLDNVVAAVSGLSREKTKSLILSGPVSLNHLEVTNISKTLKEKDVLTVRGKGKFVINGIMGETKKHRLRISVTHYR